ncbi:uncharacterized protein LOC114076796 isoform X1 [Solanum pennellii]|uniref:Uncharacterized protein LOC114076796 isoform X1 n=1 Tax=Solanum pennellii TaxID=28526 RepID=A0ABM1V8N9_SOLPN|nr:uncharacterized protein LOC114076796 isoform X1 [Solanum pennellii]
MIFYCGLSNFRLELIGIGIIGGLLSQEVVKVGKLLPELWIKNGDLKEACSVSGLERVQELKKIVITFEEKIYSAAKSQACTLNLFLFVRILKLAHEGGDNFQYLMRKPPIPFSSDVGLLMHLFSLKPPIPFLSDVGFFKMNDAICSPLY